MSLKKLAQITEGYTRLAKSRIITETPAEILSYTKRMAICLECNHYKESECCALCGCYMPAKARVQSAKCPLGKW